MARGKTILSFGGGKIGPGAQTVTGALTVTGQILAADGTAAAPGISFTSAPNSGFYATSGNVGWTIGGVARALLGTGAFQLASNVELNWGSGAIGSASDIRLVRDAANILALRNGTTAQQLNVYNTFTDASNYERLVLGFISNTCSFIVTKLGTGSDRSMEIGCYNATGTLFLSTGSNTRWAITSAGHLRAQSNLDSYNGNSALATTATAGFLGVNSCAGPPTGVPAGIPTGQIPLCYDSTNDQLYIYRAGWKKIPAVSYS